MNSQFISADEFLAPTGAVMGRHRNQEPYGHGAESINTVETSHPLLSPLEPSRYGERSQACRKYQPTVPLNRQVDVNDEPLRYAIARLWSPLAPSHPHAPCPVNAASPAERTNHMTTQIHGSRGPARL